MNNDNITKIYPIKNLLKLKDYIDLNDKSGLHDNDAFETTKDPEDKTKTIKVPVCDLFPNKDHKAYIYGLLSGTPTHNTIIEIRPNSDNSKYITTNYGMDELKAIYSYLEGKLIPKPSAEEANLKTLVRSIRYTRLTIEETEIVDNIKVKLLWKDSTTEPWAKLDGMTRSIF